MFEQDYLIRLIKEMVRAVLKLLFNIDTQSPTVELLESEEEKATLENLLDMVDAGDINGAENLICDLISDRNKNNLEIALLFYSYLNDKTDEFLENHDFSREEIRLGIKGVVSAFGVNGMTEIFLADL